MVGNAYPYSYDNWVSDINLAGSRGVDAFALNVGNEVWESDRMDDAYAAALTTVDNSTDTPSFGMFLSLDMTSLSCADDNDAITLAKLVQRYAGHPAQLRNNGRVVLSTFEGDECGFGSAGWEKVVDGLNVWFLPVFFGEIASWSQWGVVDGAFNWNSGWPSGDQNVTWDSDAWWISQMPSGKSYVAAASPWFFTHYGPDTYNKNWIYRGDDWLLAMRWELIVAHRDQIDMVEIISWNDFGESHYVGPIEGAQPMSEAWTNGFDHQGWLDMMSYYIQAFKTGIYPTVGQDQIFMWARLAPANATASADNVGQPDNWQWTKDYAWAVAFLKSPANVTLTCGTSTATFSLQGGASKIKLPLVDSCSITANVMRAGALVSAFSPEGLAFNSSQPETYNFNAIVTVSPGF
ncbi:glycoside hydrolase family 71 protein [Auriscalpium vulgare]|uniref:Glycoside hydrolase family 71 protein n=1 Tax=Auriscalpium vulgare TaxID=40419 RepID=A0ACB8RW94_9AGAM|nr:glycoside hydrolase family 71 protein [Auriscalpium vulgare]